MSKPVGAILSSANAKVDHIPTLIQPPSVVIRSLCFPRPYAGVGILLNGDDEICAKGRSCARYGEEEVDFSNRYRSSELSADFLS